MREKLAILISGGGTTMSEIIKAQQSGKLDLDIACIISNKYDAGGIQKAKDLGIPKKDIVVVETKPRSNFGQRLLDELQSRDVTAVSQNGWLPLTPVEVINAYPNKIFNQHPGNPLNFGGKDMWGLTVHQAAINYFKATGEEPNTYVIVQQVAKHFDEGQVLKATPVLILPNDTAKSLQERALPIEHQTVVELLKDLVNDNIKPVELPKITNPQKLEILNRCRQNAIDMHLNN
jgi:phosphoribosylglycinamide formyltransferase 1